MKVILITLSLMLIGCRTKDPSDKKLVEVDWSKGTKIGSVNIIRVKDCQYVYLINNYSYAGNQLVHYADCDNINHR